jgi:hypothetical protein
MQKISILLLLVFIVIIKSFGQSDSIKATEIDKYVYNIDTLNTKFDSFKITIDSIQVEIKKSKHIIVTKNHFKKSNTTLIITYFFDDEKIVLIKVLEPSKKIDKMYRYSNFYYENENVIYERHRGTWQSGLAFDINKDYSDIFGYNKSMTIDFLRTYVIKLYGKLLNYR